MPIEVESAAARALRALQRYDALVPAGQHRPLLIEAMNKLGEVLGLECEGEDEGGGWYDHSGSTCLIHEWLVLEDAGEVDGEFRRSV